MPANPPIGFRRPGFGATNARNGLEAKDQKRKSSGRGGVPERGKNEYGKTIPRSSSQSPYPNLPRGDAASSRAAERRRRATKRQEARKLTVEDLIAAAQRNVPQVTPIHPYHVDIASVIAPFLQARQQVNQQAEQGRNVLALLAAQGNQELASEKTNTNARLADTARLTGQANAATKAQIGANDDAALADLKSQGVDAAGLRALAAQQAAATQAQGALAGNDQAYIQDQQRQATTDATRRAADEGAYQRESSGQLNNNLAQAIFQIALQQSQAQAGAQSQNAQADLQAQQANQQAQQARLEQLLGIPATVLEQVQNNPKIYAATRQPQVDAALSQWERMHPGAYTDDLLRTVFSQASSEEDATKLLQDLLDSNDKYSGITDASLQFARQQIANQYYRDPTQLDQNEARRMLAYYQLLGLTPPR